MGNLYTGPHTDNIENRKARKKADRAARLRDINNNRHPFPYTGHSRPGKAGKKKGR